VGTNNSSFTGFANFAVELRRICLLSTDITAFSDVAVQTPLFIAGKDLLYVEFHYKTFEG
jgi:hypothetical protein